MDLISDILLAAGALGAGLYCFVLGRRLARFNDLEKGVGGAVAVLSAQVDDLTKTLEAAQKTAGASADSLKDLTGRGEQMARRLELHLASLHDLPQHEQTNVAEQSAAPQKAAAPTTEPMFTRHTIERPQ